MENISEYMPEFLLGGFLFAGGAMLLQIAILAFLFYWIMRLLKGAPGLWQLCVVIVTLAVLHLLADMFNMQEIEWLLGTLFKSLPVIIVILFADEIRRVFGKFTRHIQNTFFIRRPGGERYGVEVIDGLCMTIERLAASHTGALIAMEQVMDLETYCRTGKLLDAQIGGKNELLETIFFKGSPLHDGGVVIRHGRIEAAACIFPVSQEQLPANFGLRHRAAYGLSQCTDALVLVVSEETGAVHVALNGMMTTIVSGEQLKKQLQQCFMRQARKEKAPWQIKATEYYHKVKAFFVVGRKMFHTGDKKD